MRDLVEAGFDVAFHDPLVLLGREQAHLGHRVMSPAIGAEPVRAREEIRLEDRLQHQLQGCLHHPVGDRRDPEAAQLAARLGNHPLPHRHGPETAVLDLRPQPVEEFPGADPHLDGRRCAPVHPGGARTLVAPHPTPGDQQEAGIGNEIEQVVEPAMWIITSPTVQLGLDLQYPALGLYQGPFQFVGIHRRQPPGIPVSLPLTCWPPWPCGRLSRPPRRVVTPATTTGPPPHPRPSAGIGPARRRAGCPAGRATADGSHVHHAIDRSGRCPALLRQHRHAYAAALQRGLPTGTGTRLRSWRVRPGTATSRTAHWPVSTRFEPANCLRSFNHWFALATPSDLARRTRTVR